MTGVRSVVALVGLLLVGGCGAQSGSSSGSCAGPRAALSLHHVSPGDRLTVTLNYTVACQETDPGAVTVVPARYRAVKILLIQGATQTTLATVDTDRDGHLSTAVTIPAGARTGDAFIRADHAEAAFLIVE